MRLIYRLCAAIVFACVMLGVYISPVGQFLEREYGLPLLYSLRGDRPVPQEALIIGLDNESVRWLSSYVAMSERSSPRLNSCLTDRAREDLRGAANINHIPRAIHACLLDALTERQARLIAFDINFNTTRPGDAQFAEAIARAGNVLLFERVGNTDGLPERKSPASAFLNVALGTMAFHADSAQGEIATGYRTRYSPFNDLVAMPDKAWTVYTDQQLPAEQPLVQPIWLYGPPGSIPTVPLDGVFGKEGRAELPEDLSGRMIFVGSSDPSDASIDDHFPVPTSGRGNDLIGGVELAATAFLNRLHGTMLERPEGLVPAAIVFALAALGALAVLSFAGIRLWLTIAGLAAGYLAAAGATFSQAQVWLPVAVPVFLTALMLSLAALAVRYLFAKALVTRLAPRQVASTLLHGTVADRGKVKTEHATIMFTDLVGSTAMAEAMNDTAYTDSVNLYYDTATEVIEGENGMVVEFMGDGIIAMFSESVSGLDHAARCCRAARELVHRLTAENEAMGADRPALSIRIGINTGLTATGEIGARRRFNFKALGDVVNVAARLEQMGKEVTSPEPHVMLISDAVFQAAGLEDDAVETLGPTGLRGRRQEIVLHRLKA